MNGGMSIAPRQIQSFVQALLQQSGFNLYRLPLTAVGFIRKRCRDTMFLWSKGTILEAVVVILCGSVGAGAVATHHGYFGFGGFGNDAENGGNLLGHFLTAHGAVETVHVALFHEGFGHGTTAGLTTSAAVGTGEHLGHLVDERIFYNLELLCDKIQ